MYKLTHTHIEHPELLDGCLRRLDDGDRVISADLVCVHKSGRIMYRVPNPTLSFLRKEINSMIGPFQIEIDLGDACLPVQAIEDFDGDVFITLAADGEQVVLH